MEPIVGYAVLTAVFAAGASWGAVKHSLNGVKGKINETHERLTTHIKDESAADLVTHERIVSVETKVDLLIDKIK